MDRLPKPAPFPVGTRLRYVGTLETFRDPEGKQRIFGPGMEGVVSEVRPGRQGTLRDISDPDIDDEPIYDTTRDGCSVIVINGFGRVVRPDEADWEEVRLTSVSKREREILEALKAGSHLAMPSGHTSTYRLRKPTDPFYAGQVIRAPTVRSLRDAGLINTSLELTDHGRAVLDAKP